MGGRTSHQTTFDKEFHECLIGQRVLRKRDVGSLLKKLPFRREPQVLIFDRIHSAGYLKRVLVVIRRVGMERVTTVPEHVVKLWR